MVLSLENLGLAATDMRTTSDGMSAIAEEMSSRTAAVSTAAAQASANVEAVAAAAEEMATSVNEIGRQVEDSARISGAAVDQARNTDDRINALSQAASRIGEVVGLITSIAEQTNMLALNATIEAARAGEAGRGFAVVAQEVKQLASQTAKATNEIGSQIAGMQTATQDSVVAIKEIGGTIAHISEIASAIAAAVEEQGAATQEIARNVQQAAHGTGHVSGNIIGVNQARPRPGWRPIRSTRRRKRLASRRKRCARMSTNSSPASAPPERASIPGSCTRSGYRRRRKAGAEPFPPAGGTEPLLRRIML